MSVTLRTNLGFTEAVIADDGSLNLFYQVASILSDKFGIRFLNKEDEFDSISWAFRYKGNPLALHYNIYNGISLYAPESRDTSRQNHKLISQLASQLEVKL